MQHGNFDKNLCFFCLFPSILAAGAPLRPVLYSFGKARGKKPRGVDGFFERIARRTDLDEKRARRHVLVVAGVAHGDGAHEGRIVFVQGFLHGAGKLEVFPPEIVAQPAAVRADDKFELRRAGVIDGIVAEPEGGAHLAPQAVMGALDRAIADQLQQLDSLSSRALVAARYEKFRRMGGAKEGSGT